MSGMNIPDAAGGWRFTRHAREKIAERGFDVGDVVAACNQPEQRYTAYPYGPNRWVYQRGRVAVAVDPTSRAVITVLLREGEAWDDEDARRANGHPA